MPTISFNVSEQEVLNIAKGLNSLATDKPAPEVDPMVSVQVLTRLVGCYAIAQGLVCKETSDIIAREYNSFHRGVGSRRMPKARRTL